MTLSMDDFMSWHVYNLPQAQTKVFATKVHFLLRSDKQFCQLDTGPSPFHPCYKNTTVARSAGMQNITLIIGITLQK